MIMTINFINKLNKCNIINKFSVPEGTLAGEVKQIKGIDTSTIMQNEQVVEVYVIATMSCYSLYQTHVSGKYNIALIAGASAGGVGGLLFFVIITMTVCYICRKYKKNKKQSHDMRKSLVRSLHIIQHVHDSTTSICGSSFTMLDQGKISTQVQDFF